MTVKEIDEIGEQEFQLGEGLLGIMAHVSWWILQRSQPEHQTGQ